jgi:hypothetical protein
VARVVAARMVMRASDGATGAVAKDLDAPSAFTASAPGIRVGAAAQYPSRWGVVVGPSRRARRPGAP